MLAGVRAAELFNLLERKSDGINSIVCSRRKARNKITR